MAKHTEEPKDAGEPISPEVDDAAELENEAPSDETELERLSREREEMRISWQRAAADYQNLKRRTAADIDRAVDRAVQSALTDVLVVLDNLDMALKTAVESDDAKNLMVGVQITRDQLVGALERQGVTPIATDGAFDPDVHQAVATVETADDEPGTILETVRSGWMLKDQVLRFAQVRVATAPTEASEDAEGA